jgi:SAM-dependent methyltransferase
MPGPGRVLSGLTLPLFRLRSAGKPRFKCPICDYHGPFRDIMPETGLRRHALCPNCGSPERHRLQYLVLKRLLDARNTANASLLHFAPEPFFRGFFRDRFGTYETADLFNTEVDHTVDIQALPFEDARYDIVFASHVLEHVPDDHQAIAEIRRILKPGGIALLPVPIVAERTVEYSAPNPHESGHVRAPGYDYFDRYRRRFARVELMDSAAFPSEYQLFVYEDRSRYPTPACPRRPPMAGERHRDVVPVCYV